MTETHRALFDKYGARMYAPDIAAEMRLSVGTIRNRRNKENLPFPTTMESQRISCKTSDFAAWLER